MIVPEEDCSRVEACGRGWFALFQVISNCPGKHACKHQCKITHLYLLIHMHTCTVLASFPGSPGNEAVLLLTVKQSGGLLLLCNQFLCPFSNQDFQMFRVFLHLKSDI